MNRFVFGRGENKKNTVIINETLTPLFSPELEGQPAQPKGYVAWASRKLDANTDDIVLNTDVQNYNLKLEPGEVRFVRIEVPPGVESPMHRTPQIIDYLVGLSGALKYVMEDGSEVVIQAGDMFVQLAGHHYWRNEGAEPFVMAGVVIGIDTDEVAPTGGVEVI